MDVWMCLSEGKFGGFYWQEGAAWVGVQSAEGTAGKGACEMGRARDVHPAPLPGASLTLT